RKHRAVRNWIEKFIAMPTGGEWTGFRLAVADHYEGEQVRMVVRRTVSVRDAVSQFTTFVDASGCFRSGVAANPARKGELFKEALHSREVFTLLWINLRISSLQVRLRQDSWCTMSRPRDKNCVQVILVDQPVEVNVSEGLPRIRAPVAQQSRLSVCRRQRLSEQRVVLEIEHTQTQVQACMPVSVDIG